MLITATIVRSDGTEGEVNEQVFGIQHSIGIGFTSLAELTDVTLDAPSDTQVLTYDADTGKWINADAGGGGGSVDSVFGRTGDVTAASDDYTFAQLASKPTTVAGYGITDAVPTTRTVNGHALSSNVTVSASDVGAPTGSGTSTGTNTGDQDLSGLVPKTTTVNGHALSANVSVTAADVGSPSGSGTSSGTNTGDQTSIVGITGTLAQFNTALTGTDFASGGGTVTGASSGTNTGDQTSIVGISGTLSEFNTALTGADFATGGGTVSGTSSGTNTGDQTTVSGNAGTATALQTARAINGVNFDGTAPITVAAAAGTLTGATLASGVTASSLTSLGSTPTIVTPSITTGFTIGGAAASGKIIKANGTNFVASTETFPAATTNAAVLTSDGTNWTNAFPAVIVLSAKNVAITTTGSPKDIATITIPAGITRWRAFSASTTSNLSWILNESQTGTMAAASIAVRDATAGGGNIIFSATNPPATSGPTTVGWIVNSSTLTYTSGTLTVRQTIDAANTGVISFYVAIQPLL